MKTKEKYGRMLSHGIKRLVGILVISLVLIMACKQEKGTPKEAHDRRIENVDNNVVIALNDLTYTIAYEHDQFYSLIGIRTLTMVHLAIHDALNAVAPKYEVYAYSQEDPEADLVVAASEATKRILLAAYPKRADTISLVCNRWINPIDVSLAKRKGISLGIAIANRYSKLRKGDGHEKQGDYTPMSKPGDYQYTPGWDGYVLKPDFDYAKPFAMDFVSQFRSPPPPKINSSAYTTSYNEVKAYGKKDSKVRSQNQTDYAHWWAEFAEHGWNRIGRITAKNRNLPIHETARMFALINMDIYDIYLASLEAKYFYDTWRPYTAIRQAATDGNPDTGPDPNWEPEMQTPPWPEYPSAHAAVGAGGAEIVSHVYGTPMVSFSMESTAALPRAKTMVYQNLDSAARDCADSRVMNGFHFRFATEEGRAQGRKVAQYIISNFLRQIQD